MKKGIYLLALLATVAASAQSGIRVGANVGGTLSWIRGNDAAEDNDPAVDFLVGASLEVPINEKLSFFTSVNYERKSVTNTIEIDNPFIDFDPIVNTPPTLEVDVRYTLHYIAVPLNLRYYLDSQKKFYVNGGAYVGFFAGESVRVDGDKADREDEDYFKTADFGINLGFGMRIPLTAKQTLDIEVRDNLGLSNISDAPIIDDGTLKTNALNLIVNYSFGL